MGDERERDIETEYAAHSNMIIIDAFMLLKFSPRQKFHTQCKKKNMFIEIFRPLSIIHVFIYYFALQWVSTIRLTASCACVYGICVLDGMAYHGLHLLFL